MFPLLPKPPTIPSGHGGPNKRPGASPPSNAPWFFSPGPPHGFPPRIHSQQAHKPGENFFLRKSLPQGGPCPPPPPPFPACRKPATKKKKSPRAIRPCGGLRDKAPPVQRAKSKGRLFSTPVYFFFFDFCGFWPKWPPPRLPKPRPPCRFRPPICPNRKFRGPQGLFPEKPSASFRPERNNPAHRGNIAPLFPPPKMGRALALAFFCSAPALCF